MRNTMIARCTVALIGVLAVAAAAENSGGWRGPNRNGIYPATGLLKKWPENGPKLLWKYDRLGVAWSTVTVHEGKVYALGGWRKGYLHCFSLDGKLLWRKAYGPDREEGRFPGPRSTVEIADGRAIFATGDAVVYGMNAATGKVVWSVDTAKAFGNQVPGHGYNLTPLVYDGKVICPIRRGQCTHAALDVRTGRTVWTNKASEYAIGDSSPILVTVGRRRLVVDNLWWAIVAIDPADGRIVWTHKEGRTGTMMTPVFNEGRLFIDMGTHKPALLEPVGGKDVFRKCWQIEEKGLFEIDQALILGDKLFVVYRRSREVTETVEKDGKKRERTRTERYLALEARDLKTGRLLQSEPLREEGAMVAADGMIYLLEGGPTSRYGKPKWVQLSLIRPTKDGFEIVSRFEPLLGTVEGWIHPCIAEGRLFHRLGNLLAVYDLRAASYK